MNSLVKKWRKVLMFDIDECKDIEQFEAIYYEIEVDKRLEKTISYDRACKNNTMF